MKCLITILIFLNAAFFNAQDLDLVSPPSSQSDTSAGSSLLSKKEVQEQFSVRQSNQIDVPNPEEERESSTYRKEEYLNAILRKTYYHRIMTPSWAKYLSFSSWNKSVRKWRYWTHLKHYITDNEKQIIELRPIQTPVVDSTLAVVDESIDTTATTDSIAGNALALLTSPSGPPTSLIPDIEIQKEQTTQNNESPIPSTEIKEVKTDLPEEPKKVTSSIPPTVARSDEKPLNERTEDKPVENKPVEEKALVKHNTASVPQPNMDRSTMNRLFLARKGSHSWPVYQGRITDRFGVRENAAARGLRRENFGIDMLCPAGLGVRAIHDGTVLMSMRQAPYDLIITVKHGDYTSAYFYLERSNLKPGDPIKEGQILGYLSSGKNPANFHFEIWDDQNRVNPELWLKQR